MSLTIRPLKLTRTEKGRLFISALVLPSNQPSV